MKAREILQLVYNPPSKALLHESAGRGVDTSEPTNLKGAVMTLFICGICVNPQARLRAQQSYPWWCYEADERREPGFQGYSHQA
jgi:hypothetical protein